MTLQLVRYDAIPESIHQDVVIATPDDIGADEQCGLYEEPGNVQLRCACIVVPLRCVLVLAIVSLILTWVADINSANYILTIPLVASISIIGFVGFPAGICCLRLRSDHSLRSHNLFKFTFYVAVSKAGPIASVGIFSAGLLQAFFTTNHKHDVDFPTLGGYAASVNLLAAIICFIIPSYSAQRILQGSVAMDV